MRKLVIAGAAALLLMTGPALAHPAAVAAVMDPQGALQAHFSALPLQEVEIEAANGIDLHFFDTDDRREN